MVSFYKPNKKNSGAACSFTWNDKEGSVFISMIKQHSWNEKTRNGSFKENYNNPKAKLYIKLTPTEVADIINSVERRCECSGYHSSPNQIVKFSFKPGFTNDNEFRGLSFSAMKESKDDSTDKIQILVGFNAADLVMLREFLRACLAKHFEKLIKENLEKLAARSNNGSENTNSNTSSPKQASVSESSETYDNSDDEEIW
jgi:hypothetical protein|tara:strand:+ start:723 stop:1322 length:600 start_codon:yes stop_codon:yes gene_type:complete